MWNEMQHSVCRRIRVLAVCYVLLPCVITDKCGLAADALNSDTADAIEFVVQRFMARHGIPGLSIAVARQNELCYAQGYGLADVEHDVAATADTVYRTASIAKPMTAALVLSLAAAGRIDPDQSVQQYVPGFPEKRWPVTTRQLLAHQGGIRHYKSSAEASATEHYFSLEAALQVFAEDPLIHEPGTAYRYTSFGYNLLGSVAEGAGGDSFMKLLQDQVLRPAGMERTLADDVFAVIPGRARGYIRPAADDLRRFPEGHQLVAGHLYNSTLHDTSMKIPGGGLVSSAGDLVRFATALNRGELLSEEWRQQMWTAQQTSDGRKTSYGLGWFVGEQTGRPAVWHSGAQSGTSTMLLLLPENGTCVAVMCNLQGMNLTSLATQIARLADPGETDYEPGVQKLRAAIEYEVELKSLPAFSLAMVDGERTVWSDGFGFQDAAERIGATADTIYRVGSISKLFTDIAVMQQVAAGKLDLDVPVQTWLPDFRPHSEPDQVQTLRQMMSHMSGLVRESPVGSYFDPDEPTLAATVASLNQTKLVYPPGNRTKYSNAAVAVVGAVLESRLDSSHPEYVRSRILDPLQMSSSSFTVTPQIAPQLAVGWMRTLDGRRFEAPGFLLGTGPAGNMYTSVNDLAKFLSWMFSGNTADGTEVLSPEMLEAMMQPVRNNAGEVQPFGLGFHVGEFEGQRKIGHGGAVYGFSTQLEALPDRRLGVVAAASLDGTNGVVSRLAEYALRLMLAIQDGKPLPEYRTTLPVPQERAADLVGHYLEQNGTRTTEISELNGEVTMLRGTYRQQLRSAADDGQILIDDETGFGTIVASGGDADLAVGSLRFDRRSDEPPAECPEEWRGLIGEYGHDHNVLYILEDHGRLCALIEWFYHYPLEQISEDVFAFPDYGLYHGEYLRFTRGDDGIAIAVNAAEVDFDRRAVGTRDGETFRIKPVRPIDELRAAAMLASPPNEPRSFRDTDLVELTRQEPTIHLDIRYATTNNFTGAVFYQQPRAFLQRPAAEAVQRAQQKLQPLGLGLLIHDAYRPWHVTKMFWDATPTELRDFVANPANGSRHNRGCAVDLTLCDLKTGDPIQMVAGYDEFSPRSFPRYPGGTSRQRWYRELLRKVMESEGFTIYEYEWWHFDYQDWQQYRLGNAAFEQLSE